MNFSGASFFPGYEEFELIHFELRLYLMMEK